ncbi:MAG: adenylosuccinate synthetase, partial [Deltaproteobacteria bacterium]
YQGKRIHTIPADTSILSKVKPVYETLPGWNEDLTQVRNPQDIPQSLQNYLRFIENFTGTRINLVSTGAGREAVIDIQKAF